MILDDFTKNILNKHNAKIVFDYEENDRLRVYIISEKMPKVKGYMSLYYHDRSTFEVSSVVGDKGFGKLLYSLAALKMAQDGFWVSPSTTGDTNSSATKVWEKFRNDIRFKNEDYSPVTTKASNFRMTTTESLEQFSSYITEVSVDDIYSLRNDGQMYFSIMYNRESEEELSNSPS